MKDPDRESESSDVYWPTLGEMQRDVCEVVDIYTAVTHFLEIDD